MYFMALMFAGNRAALPACRLRARPSLRVRGTLRGGDASRQYHDDLTENPNGILSQSPGLRGTSYPGNQSHRKNPKRGFAFGTSAKNGQRLRAGSRRATTPLGLGFFL